MYKKYWLGLLLLLLGLSLVPPLHAAPLRARDAAISIEDASNPRPAKDDLILPMPCGGSMVFRAIAVQAEGFLWDMSTTFGCDSCERGSRDYYERRYPAAISGPFSLKDFPIAWQAKLPRPLNGRYFYYLIGKYEVSNFQWKIIMENWCPENGGQLSADDARPKTNISWFEALEFSRRYTEWLLRNHPQSLPRFVNDSKNVGYVRLPTELEWEYAARGAHKVSRDLLRQEEFFHRQDNAPYTDYAVFRPENAARIEQGPLPIGSRQPNPAGLYDTAGNVAEMTMDLFHFSLGGRLHGSSGGFVRKGGSYLSGLSEIMPGRREEVALFQAEGASSANDMGLRLVLSGINTPAGDRPATLEREWRLAGESLVFDQGKNPLEELDRIIAATTSYREKENLERLRSIIKDNNIALQRQNDLAAEGLVQTSLYMIQTLRNYALRHKMFINEISRARLQYEEDKMRNRLNEESRKRYEQTLATLENGAQEVMRSLDAALGYYRSKVEESLNYPEAMFNNKLKIMQEELARQDDVLSRQMQEAFTAFARHAQLMRQGKRAELNRNNLLKDILPENLRQGMEL